MKFLGKLKFSNNVCALVIGAGLVAVPALAQASLTAEQLAAVESSLRVALQSALSQGTAAIESAISNAELSAISLYGAGNTPGITSAVIQYSEKQSVDQCTIGRGLAKAAGGLATTDMTSAQAVAGTLANEGAAMERSCFKTAMEQAGYTQLAALADESPTVTGGTGQAGGAGIGAGIGGAGASATGGGGCLNPSCTSL